MYFQRFYIEGENSELQRLYKEFLDILNDREMFHLNEWTERYSLNEPKSNDLTIPSGGISYKHGKIIGVKFDSKKNAVYFEQMGNSFATTAVKHILELNYQSLKFFYYTTWDNDGYESNDSEHKYFDFYEYDFCDWESNFEHYVGHSEEECVEKYNQKNGTARKTIANKKGIRQEKRLVNIQADALLDGETLFVKLPWWLKHQVEIKCRENGKSIENAVKLLLRDFVRDEIGGNV